MGTTSIDGRVQKCDQPLSLPRLISSLPLADYGENLFFRRRVRRMLSCVRPGSHSGVSPARSSSAPSSSARFSHRTLESSAASRPTLPGPRAGSAPGRRIGGRPAPRRARVVGGMPSRAAASRVSRQFPACPFMRSSPSVSGPASALTSPPRRRRRSRRARPCGTRCASTPPTSLPRCSRLSAPRPRAPYLARDARSAPWSVCGSGRAASR